MAMQGSLQPAFLLELIDRGLTGGREIRLWHAADPADQAPVGRVELVDDLAAFVSLDTSGLLDDQQLLPKSSVASAIGSGSTLQTDS
jgi:hypothetical protein